MTRLTNGVKVAIQFGPARGGGYHSCAYHRSALVGKATWTRQDDGRMTVDRMMTDQHWRRLGVMTALWEAVRQAGHEPCYDWDNDRLNPLSADGVAFVTYWEARHACEVAPAVAAGTADL